MTAAIENSRKLEAGGLTAAGAWRILITQSAITAGGCALFAFSGLMSAISALLGGLACMVPNAYAIWRVFGAGRASTKSGLVTFALMIRAEFAKFFLTGVMFALSFWLVPGIDPLATFSVFVAAMFAGWIEAGLRMN